MIDIKRLIGEVQQNCDISDARYAGLYSLCGLALRLRDLYKWERRRPPWQEDTSGAVLDWIDARERRWETLQEAGLIPLTFNGRGVEAFHTDAINRRLAPHGLFYGAGYGRGLKPCFFLARIARLYVVDGHPVCELGEELARDLQTLPAMTQDGAVVVRREAAALYVWDQMFYISPSGKPFLADALRAAGIPDGNPATLRRHLPAIVSQQLGTFVGHEIGELHATAFGPGLWREMIAALAHTPAELLLRALKDTLADTGPAGTLMRIAAAEHRAALGFFLAFSDGLGRALFPELRAAFAPLAASGDWRGFQGRVAAVHRRCADMAVAVSALYREGLRREDMGWVGEEIRRRYLAALSATAAAAPSD
jgi:hypothetical protein